MYINTEISNTESYCREKKTSSPHENDSIPITKHENIEKMNDKIYISKQGNIVRVITKIQT